MKAHVSFLKNGFPILQGAFITKDYKKFHTLFRYGITPYVKDREYCVELLNSNNLYAPPVATYYYPKIDGRYCYFRMLKGNGVSFFKYALCDNHMQQIKTDTILLPQQETHEFFKQYFSYLVAFKFSFSMEFDLEQNSLDSIFDSLLEVYESQHDAEKTLLVTPGHFSIVN